MDFFIKTFKYPLLAAFAVLAIQTVSAQATKDKLYGYVQASVPGVAAAKKVTDDAGNVIQQQASGVAYTYFIYLTTTAKTQVYPIEIWIKGNPYSAETEAISTTAVQRTLHLVPGRPQKITLVPKTTQKITQLIPVPLIGNKTTAKAKSLAAANELVVVYKQSGKTYYKTLKSLSELGVQALQ